MSAVVKARRIAALAGIGADLSLRFRPAQAHLRRSDGDRSRVPPA
jgi:hypothetical protein